MRNIRRVVWAKGMLLTPQHFQAHTNYVEDILQFRFSGTCFENWGVLAISCNEEALANGQFAITKFRGVFPDGTLVDCPAVDKEPAVRSFTFPQDENVLDVFFGIPHKMEGHNVVIGKSGDNGSLPVRHAAQVAQIADENGIDEKKPVHFAQRNISILFGEREAQSFECIRIAQIVRTQAGKYALNPEFIPPLLEVSANNKLKEIVERQIEILIAKSQALGNARRQRGKALADFNASETSNFWLLHTVNSFLPELTHAWNVRKGHPEPLYVAMLKLAGALCSFSLDKDIRSLPAYDHNNLGKCFAALDTAILDLLETVIDSNCESVPLKQNQKLWTARITKEEWVNSAKLFLSVGADLGQDDVIRRTPQLIKVAEQDQIDMLVKRALPGLTLRHEPQPPPSIPFRLENQYFSLNQAGIMWDGIVRSRTISFYVPTDFPNPRLELFAVKILKS